MANSQRSLFRVGDENNSEGEEGVLSSKPNLSREANAEKGRQQAQPSQSWFSKIPINANLAKSSHASTQLGHQGSLTESSTERSTGEKNAITTGVFSFPSSNDSKNRRGEGLIFDTKLTSSTPFRFGNHGQAENKTQNGSVPWPVKPLFSSGLFESSVPNPASFPTVSTPGVSQGIAGTGTQAGPIFAKPTFPWCPEIPSANDNQAQKPNPPGSSPQFSRNIIKEQETGPYSFYLSKTTRPMAFPAWPSNSTIPDGLYQNSSASGSSRPPTSSPVHPSVAPVFSNPPFSFSSSPSIPNRAIAQDTQLNTPFNPFSLESTPASMSNSFSLENVSVPMINQVEEKEISGAKTTAIHDLKDIPKEPTLNDHNPSSSADETLTPMGKDEPGTSGINQPSAEEIFTLDEEVQHHKKKSRKNRKSKEREEPKHAPPKLVSSTFPKLRDHSSAKQPGREMVNELMANIASVANVDQYREFMFMISELYTQYNVPVRIAESKARDLMKRILRWYINKPKLCVDRANCLLPVGFHFNSYLYWENESLQIILSASTLEHIVYVDIMILGEFGYGGRSLFKIGELALMDRGPIIWSNGYEILKADNSALTTICGLFKPCKNINCNTVLRRVLEKLSVMRYPEGSPPDYVPIELFCNASRRYQKTHGIKEPEVVGKIDLAKRQKADKDFLWEEFTKVRKRYEDAMMYGDDDEEEEQGGGCHAEDENDDSYGDEIPPTAEHSMQGNSGLDIKKSKPDEVDEDPNSPYSSSPEPHIKELLEKMKGHKLDDATAKILRVQLDEAKVVEKKCFELLDKMVETIRISNGLIDGSIDPAEVLRASGIDPAEVIANNGSIGDIPGDAPSILNTGRNRSATVIAEGVEFIMENLKQQNPASESGPSSAPQDETGSDEEHAGRANDKNVEKDMVTDQSVPGPADPKQGSGSNKGKNKKKGKKGKNNWKRL